MSDDGGFAFPTVYLDPVIKDVHLEDGGKNIRYQFGSMRNEGMSLRDWLVGQCLSGLALFLHKDEGGKWEGNDTPEYVVGLAETYADEYLRRRAELVKKMQKEMKGEGDEQP